MSRDRDLKVEYKRLDHVNRFQGEDQHCCQQYGGHGQHGGHDMDSRDAQCKSELERLESQMCKGVNQARCDVGCKRATKKCESNNLATGRQSKKQKANKMQKKGEECSSLIEGGDVNLEIQREVEDTKGKMRTGVAGRICNNKESCQKNICKTWETPPTFPLGAILNS